MTAEGFISTDRGAVVTEEKGAYLPPRSISALVNYIHDLRECIHR